jgi:hypothetical protein
MKRIIFILIIVIVVPLFGCITKGDLKPKAPLKAVYLVSDKGGEVSKQDLAVHPEVLVVHTVSEFKNAAKRSGSVWIDKNSLDKVDQDWFRKWPQKSYVTAVIGYSDVGYAHGRIGGFNVTGIFSRNPDVQGYCVWKLFWESGSGKSAFLMGYNEQPTVDRILAKTEILRLGKAPNDPGKNGR